jgi:hypothetical protein
MSLMRIQGLSVTHHRSIITRLQLKFLIKIVREKTVDDTKLRVLIAIDPHDDVRNAFWAELLGRREFLIQVQVLDIYSDPARIITDFNPNVALIELGIDDLYTIHILELLPETSAKIALLPHRDTPAPKEGWSVCIRGKVRARDPKRIIQAFHYAAEGKQFRHPLIFP